MLRWVWPVGMLLTVACEGSRAEQKCSAIAYVTLAVSVSDKATSGSLCDAEVEVVDQQQRKLELRRAGDACSWVTYEGHEGSFEVRARKAGYVAATQQASMKKLPCQLSAPPVHLALERQAE